MFMNEEKDERFIRAAEVRTEVERARAVAEHSNRGWRVIGATLTTITIFTPLSIILWRAALGL